MKKKIAICLFAATICMSMTGTVFAEESTVVAVEELGENAEEEAEATEVSPEDVMEEEIETMEVSTEELTAEPEEIQEEKALDLELTEEEFIEKLDEEPVDEFDTSNLEPHPISNLLVPQNQNNVAVYRLYNETNGEHLFTTHLEEVVSLSFGYYEPAKGWKLEGIAWSAPKEGTPVYRLYQPGFDNHLYTTDKNEINVLTTEYGWQMDFEGSPVFYSGGTTAIYRVYNKGLSGMHHYTTDANEYRVLPEYGWAQEQIAFYAESIGVVDDAAVEAIYKTWVDCYAYKPGSGTGRVKPSFHSLVKSLSNPEKEAEYMDVINRMNVAWDSNASWESSHYFYMDYKNRVRRLEEEGFTEAQAIQAARLGQ